MQARPLVVVVLALAGCQSLPALGEVSRRRAEPSRASPPQKPSVGVQTNDVATADKAHERRTEELGDWTWSTTARSPWPAEAMTEREAKLSAACGAADGALTRVARKLAAEQARSFGAIDVDKVVAMLRASGQPHVRPRVVSTSGPSTQGDERLYASLSSVRTAETRCGVAFVRAETKTSRDHEVFVAISVEARADLEPLPIRVRTGEWLTLRATLLEPAASAKLVILGPRGMPRTVPTSLDGSSGSVGARFTLDRPGAFDVQLVADVQGGPRPVLEARLFADVAPPAEFELTPAPGEDAASGNDADALARMTMSLRAAESLPSLRRDARLDALARAHAEHMMRVREVAHDLGEGNLSLRFASEGLAAKSIGENLARARSVALAHRALHASPSHRMNLLRAEYTHAGFGVAADAGNIYVCEIFAAGLR